MSNKSETLELYEAMEQNKADFTATINDFFSHIDACIATRDLPALNSIYDELLKLDNEEQTPLVYSSSTFRIQSIKEALNKEHTSGLRLFWDDVSNSKELLNKYIRTIFMIRRLTSELSDEYKQEAHSYLQNISPYIVNITFNDPTVLVGKPDYVYITLAMDFMQSHHYIQALILLRFINNKNNEIFNLIEQLESLIKKDS